MVRGSLVRVAGRAPESAGLFGMRREEQSLAAMRARSFVGSVATARERIDRLVAQFALDEVVVNTWAHDPAVRRTSYALLAQAYGLSVRRT